MTRRAALKLGALGVMSAAAAAYLPGRARAGTIAPAPCRAGQGSVCGGSFTACGGPGSGCGCAFQYTGSKLTKVESYCVDYNVCCDSLATCPDGQSQCPPNTICSNKTCCAEPVCMPACGANVTAAACCLSPKGQVGGGPHCCPNPGNCNGFSNCAGNDNCFCFTTTEGGGFCGLNFLCAELQGCSSSADCPSGSACITRNGCTNCENVGGVCAIGCSSNKAPATRANRSGMTAAGIHH